MFTIKIPDDATPIHHSLTGGVERAYWLDSSGRPMKTTVEPADFREVVVSKLGWNFDEIHGLLETFAEIHPVILQHSSNKAEVVAAHRLLLTVQAEMEKEIRGE